MFKKEAYCPKTPCVVTIAQYMQETKQNPSAENSSRGHKNLIFAMKSHITINPQTIKQMDWSE